MVTVSVQGQSFTAKASGSEPWTDAQKPHSDTICDPTLHAETDPIWRRRGATRPRTPPSPAGNMESRANPGVLLRRATARGTLSMVLSWPMGVNLMFYISLWALGLIKQV